MFVIIRKPWTWRSCWIAFSCLGDIWKNFTGSDLSQNFFEANTLKCSDLWIFEISDSIFDFKGQLWSAQIFSVLTLSTDVCYHSKALDLKKLLNSFPMPLRPIRKFFDGSDLDALRNKCALNEKTDVESRIGFQISRWKDTILSFVSLGLIFIIWDCGISSL